LSIFSFAAEYANKKPVRWHTPGHKGRLHPLDITELVCSEEKLLAALANAEKTAAEFYGAKRVRFLTGGSSIGIKAAILAAGGDVLCFSGCHQALGEGAALAKLNLYECDTGLGTDGLPNVVAAKDVAAALKKFPDVKAVFIESPDYYGRVVSTDVAELIKKSDKLFFCDAAHGAHFAAHKDLVKSCFARIADVCNLSAHKTLDAYTQTAYLCINHPSLAEPIDTALKNLGTTSPNYMLLASLETAVESAKKYDYDRLFDDVAEFKKQILCLPNGDFTRLAVDAEALGFCGKELCAKLAAQNIYAEKCTGRYVVFIATPHETSADFKNLAAVLKKLKSPDGALRM